MRITFYLLIFSLIGICTLNGCKKKANEEIPNCIEDKVNEIESGDAAFDVIEIYKWTTDHDVYYYFVADCCDQFNYLYDEECSVVCSPDGGFTGGGDGSCPDLGESVETELIWKK